MKFRLQLALKQECSVCGQWVDSELPDEKVDRILCGVVTPWSLCPCCGQFVDRERAGQGVYRMKFVRWCVDHEIDPQAHAQRAKGLLGR